MANYQKVPNIISTKDLDYLSDMFNWNYGIYKNTVNSIEKVNNSEVKAVLKKGTTLFNGNMKQILKILGGGTNE